VRGFDLERPRAIARGEVVTLIFTSGALQLSVQARAMENAAEGDTIRFVNLHSNRTVEARVERAGLARVAGGLGPVF
jgi:flagella basal body P-ring formation protein FlgA